MAAKKQIDGEILELAKIIAREASEPDRELAVRIDAFKALTAYGIGNAKIKKPPPEDDENKPTFGNFQKKIAAVK